MNLPSTILVSDPPELGDRARRPAFFHLQDLLPGLGEASWVLLDMAGMSLALLFIVFRVPVLTRSIPFARVLALRISIANVATAILCLCLWWLALRIVNAWRPMGHGSVQAHVRILMQVALCTCVIWVIARPVRPERLRADAVLAFFSLSLLCLLSVRYAVASWRMLMRQNVSTHRNVIIVGSGWRAKETADRLRKERQCRYHLLGFVDSNPCSPDQIVLGGTCDLVNLLMQHPVDEVIITLPIKSKYDEIQQAVSACEQAGVQLGYSLDLFATKLVKSRSTEERNPSSVQLHMVHNDNRHKLKRLADVVVAGSTLLLFSPLLLAIAVCVRLTSRGPVLFSQQRYGLNKRLFTMYKFRSMVVDAEARQKALEHLNEVAGPVFKIQRDPRVTPVGTVLRKFSLDELPQLWNVLKGDMSLVGPRPLPMRDVRRFEDASSMRRFSVKPGLTGLWQVSGRSNTSFENWIRLDLEYIDRWSLLLDCRIMAKTVPAVLRGEGAA